MADEKDILWGIYQEHSLPLEKLGQHLAGGMTFVSGIDAGRGSGGAVGRA